MGSGKGTVATLLTWILEVVSKQLRLLPGRVGHSTTLVNSLIPQMSELVEEDVASGETVEHFWLIRNELYNFCFSFKTFYFIFLKGLC